LNISSISKSHVIYEKHGLRIELSPKKNSSTLTQVEAKFESINGAIISNIVLQVAVPKVTRIKLMTSL
jgi:hypothetical protein